MTTRTINDPASMQRLGMLLESMQARHARLSSVAQAHRDTGSVHDAYDAQQAANHAAWVAYRVRCYMATVSDPPAADVQAEEPPRQLVPFTGWLRALVGHLLPFVTAETWQTCASLMLMDRARQDGQL